jgi:hypothetical protein
MGCVFFSGGYVGKQSRLPRGYTELAYIQSSGTQFINTGFNPNNNTRVVMDAQFVGATSQSTLYTPFGVRGSGYFYELYKASASNWNLTFLWNNTYNQYFTIDYSVRHIFEINKNVATVDSTTKTYTTGTFQLAYPLYLCADNNAGTADAKSPLKIYSCQIYDNGTLVRDFVPCISDANGVGLYDMVDGKFYGNAGSGVFLGSEVA